MREGGGGGTGVVVSYCRTTASSARNFFANGALKSTINVAAFEQVRHPSEMDVGDMFVSLAYVDRQIARDREEALSERGKGDGDDDIGVDALPRERGVSGAMADVYDLQVRAFFKKIIY